jgi:hypothetical protein
MSPLSTHQPDMSIKLKIFDTTTHAMGSVLDIVYSPPSFFRRYKTHAMGSPISAPRPAIKHLRPQIFLFGLFSLGPRPFLRLVFYAVQSAFELESQAFAWAIRSVTHLDLARFGCRRSSPFPWRRCLRTSSHAQPRFTTGSRKSSVPPGVHSVRRALVRAWHTGHSRPTLCRLTVRSNRRKKFLVRRWLPVASGSRPQACLRFSSSLL